MSVTIRQVLDFVESLAPRAVTSIDYGTVDHGDPEGACTGVAVTWTPSLGVLREAAARGMGLVVSHEFLYFPYAPSSWWHRQAQMMAKPVNLARMRALVSCARARLEAHRPCACARRMCLYRIHAPIE